MSIDYTLFAFPKKQKGTKKAKKKRVSKSTYEEVLKACKGKCGLCKASDKLELHHIYFRSEAPDKIDDPLNCIMLCHKDFSKNRCHLKVHQKKKYWQPILIKIRNEMERK